MTILCVLSGLHAGASLSLGQGRYRISSEPTIKTHDPTPTVIGITLVDWTDAPFEFQTDSQGVVLVGRDLRNAQAALTVKWLLEQKKSFGAVTLCLRDGEVKGLDGDMQATSSGYLTTFVAAGNHTTFDHSPRGRVIKSWGARACIVGTGLLVAVSALYGHARSFQAQPPDKAGFDCEWFTDNLQTRGLHELKVQKENDVVVLSGLVNNAAQGQSARSATIEFLRGSHASVVARWEVADEIASTIRTALRQPGINAVYEGQGRFRVEGSVNDPQAFQGIAAPLLKDLGPNVKGLDFLLRTVEHAVPVNAAIVAGPLHYSERHDGAKVFSRNTEGK